MVQVVCFYRRNWKTEGRANARAMFGTIKQQSKKPCNSQSVALVLRSVVFPLYCRLAEKALVIKHGALQRVIWFCIPYTDLTRKHLGDLSM